METVVLALRLLLAGVFAIAGVAKLRDPEGSRTALRDFGVPARLANPGGVLLPLAEIAIAVALLIPQSARWGALGAAALLGLFVAAIANAIAHSRAPDCHCFGQIHSEPAGWSTLARNGVLIALATTVAVAGPGPSVSEWVSDRSGLELAVLAAALAAAALALVPRRRWNQHRERKRRKAAKIAALDAKLGRAGRPVGSPAPDFSLRGLRHERYTLQELLEPGRPVALVFVHPDCIPCRRVVPRLVEWNGRLAQRITIALISGGSVDANRELLDEYGIDDLLLQERGEVYEAYEFRAGTPSAVVVDPDRTIASDAVAGEDAIEALIRLTLRRSESWSQSSAVT